jgi:hypothetical protein
VLIRGAATAHRHGERAQIALGAQRLTTWEGDRSSTVPA